MSRPHEFEATVEAMAWGRSTYTVVRVPEALVVAVREAGTRRVAGTVEDVPVNLALQHVADLGEPFLYAGAALLRRARVEVGEPVRCVLAPVDPDEVLVPPDVEDALRRAGLLGLWSSTRPAVRRRLLQPVEAARREQTRAARVESLLDAVVQEGGTGR